MISLISNDYELSSMYRCIYMLISRNIFKTFILCAVGCILKMPGSPTSVCVCFVPAGGGSVFGNSPKYKGNSTRFFFNKVSCRLARDVSLCTGHGLSGAVTVGVFPKNRTKSDHEHPYSHPYGIRAHFLL